MAETKELSPLPPQAGVSDLPLQNTWTFWYDRYQGPGQTADQYQQGQKALYDCTTVFEFWRCFQTTTPGSLEYKSSLHMMKKGIHPVWEDPENEQGGLWAMRFPVEEVEAVWRDLCLAAIGENFYHVLAEGDAINGITVSIRRTDAVIQIWNKLSKDEAETKKIVNHIITSVLKDHNVRDGYYYKSSKEHASYDSTFVPGKSKSHNHHNSHHGKSRGFSGSRN